MDVPQKLLDEGDYLQVLEVTQSTGEILKLKKRRGYWINLSVTFRLH